MSWPMVALGEVVSIKGGGTPDKSREVYWNGAIPWVSVKDFKSTEISETRDSITELGVKKSATNIVSAGTVLVPTRMAVGKAAIATMPVAINQDVKALTPSKKLDTRYLLHFLLARGGELERQATGATVKGIKLDVLRALEIPLPPLDEQKRIAAMLDKADALRRAQARQHLGCDRLIDSIFYRMFVADAAEWPEARIEELSQNIRTGPFGSQLLHSEFTESGIPVLGIDNAVQNEFAWGKPRFISEEKYSVLQRYTVLPGDVLITIMGTCGRCAIVPDDIPTTINTKHLCAITLDTQRVLPTFLHAVFLRHPRVLRQLGVQAKGAVMPGLNMGIIKNLSIPVPPIEKQRQFEALVNRISNMKSFSKRTTRAQGQLFASLQHSAFAGEL